MESKILWIEDEPEVGTYTRMKMLEAKGYKVDLALGVQEALNSLKGAEFDLIILDIMMPSQGILPEKDVKGGYETGLALMGYLRKQMINTPVIVVTGYPDTEVERRFKAEFGVQDYLFKPISQVELETDIEKTIGRG
jgi:CheY-like chemotaxis protein